jgi:hypothetical protein
MRCLHGLVRPRRAIGLAAGAIAAIALTTGAPSAHAYDSYDRFGDQTEGCVTCHPEFLSGNGALHAQHRALLGTPTQQLTRCNACHPSGLGSTPVRTYTSGPIGPLTSGFGCSGCHGRLYGEISPNSGLPKSTSYGLRQVHVDAGVAECSTSGCHAPGNLGSPDPFPTPYPEDVVPPYYGFEFSVLRNACASDEEDLPFDADLLGLDNDGDGQRDFPDDLGCPEPTEPPFDCAAVPMAGCVAPGKGVLVVTEKVASKEKLKVTLSKLQTELTPIEFGDPVAGTTGYNVCVYDAGDELRAQYTLDRPGEICSTGKPCWTTISDKGYKFKDKAAAADGVRKAMVRGGARSKGKVVVVGRNRGTMPTGVAEALANQTSATVQFVASDGICVGVALPVVKKANGLVFKAVGP